MSIHTLAFVPPFVHLVLCLFTQVCPEETVDELRSRYCAVNPNMADSVWMYNNERLPMHSTLEECGLWEEDDSPEVKVFVNDGPL